MLNSHPHRSDPESAFSIVHNGIITNYKEIRKLLENKGATFETDTDTEIVAKLTKYMYDSQLETGMNLTFSSLVKQVISRLEGSYAFIFKSSHYPNELVATRRGSPLLVGIKSEKKLKMDFVDVQFGNAAAVDPRNTSGELGLLH